MLASVIVSVSLTCLLTSGIVNAVRGNRDVIITCLEARNKCRSDENCNLLLEEMSRTCDESIYTCHTETPIECHSVLTSLQRDVHFRRCACDENDMDATPCLELRMHIFRHRCLSVDHIKGRTASIAMVRTGNSTIVKEIEKDQDDGHYTETSCIRIRKECLQDARCHGILKDFWTHCHDSKRKGVCMTTDYEKCYRAIEDLRPTGIFQCTCVMRKLSALKRCQRIQFRVAKNRCLVDVPYFIHSAKQDMSYEQLLDALNDTTTDDDLTGDTSLVHTSESTCVDAFHACNSDAGCRLRFADFLSACAWNRQTNKCQRQQCLDAIQVFYLLGRPEHAHSLLFCRCQTDDKNCESVRQNMYPTCSKVEAPPPSCISILERCKADTDCRIRLKAYDKHCGLGESQCGGSPTQCRNAQVGIMGTILTTNCMCTMAVAEENRKCVIAHARFEKKNKCTDTALKYFHERYATVADNTAIWKNDGLISNHRCRSRMAENIPAYMDVPTVIRKYSNDSFCSSVCWCLNNGTFYCRRIHCNVNFSCKHRHNTYDHGESFDDSVRGECRCIKGELVCAKSSQQLRRKQGLFLHVGYSIADQYLVEGHSALSFQPWNVADKLAALINADSAEQFCSLSLFTEHSGNLVFEISSSQNSPRKTEESLHDCTTAAQTLTYIINSRSTVILTDAELSILKVSQLERIEFYREPPLQTSASWRVRSAAALGLHSDGVTTTLICYCLALFCYTTIFRLISTGHRS